MSDSRGTGRSTTVPAVVAMADWVEAFDARSLTATGAERLRDSIVDGFGCALYGSTLPWSTAALSAVLGPADSGATTVWGSDRTAPMLVATYANGIAIHAFELDDFNDQAAGVHGTSAILPAVAAVAELGPPLSGREALTAAAVGWEVAVRVARCLGPGFPMRGWHASAIFATIGGAAAAARALRLQGDPLVHALSLGALFASGLIVARAGGMGKRIYAGQAAANGLHAALLARNGVTGPRDVFEHPNGGFCTTFAPSGDYDLAELTEDRPPMAAEGIVLKVHAACGSAHPALDGLRGLLASDESITADEIQSVTVGMSAANVRYLGQPYVPGDATAAQFNVPFCLSAMILEGEVTERQFRQELLDDPALVELAGRIRVVLDPEIDASGVERRNAARLDVRLRSGVRRGAFIDSAHGSSRDPLARHEVDAKFRSLAGTVLDADTVDRQLGLLRALDDIEDIAEVTRGFSKSSARTARHEENQ